MRSSPPVSLGASPELCDYLAGRKIAMIGSDTWGLEVMDPSKPSGGLWLLPHEPDRQAWHQQLRKPRSGCLVAGKNSRVSVHLVAAQARRRDGFTGEPDCRLVRRGERR